MPVNSFDDYPMSWKPVIDRNSKTPLYIALADALKADILEGRLAPGTKLPPQRELADFLDIHLSTITRAFKICEQRGLVCSIIGRGTFISSDAAVQGMLTIREASDKIVEMGAILPKPDVEEIITNYLKEMISEPDFFKLMQYAPVKYDKLQTQAGIRWFEYYGLKSGADNILFSSGSQNGIYAILSALFDFGDKIATTPVTYPGLKIAANSLGIQVVPLPLFDNKITVESLDYVVKNHDVKGFYFIPYFNNPSGELMDVKTRKAIADYCNTNRLPFMEDSIYSLFLPKPLPPISSFSPEYGIMIASVSKILSPGLRLAVLHIPSQYYQRVATTLYAIIITPPALMMQLFTRLINLGKFDKIRALRIQDVVERNKLFDRICPTVKSSGDIYCPLRWTFIPEGKEVNPTILEKDLLKMGIQLYSAERFVVGNYSVPQAVRISLISEHDPEKYEAGLEMINRYFA